MTGAVLLLRQMTLTIALYAQGVPDAADHVDAALAAEVSTGVSADVLLGMAYVETRYQRGVVSLVRGRRFCGPLQAQAGRSKMRCAALDALRPGYMAGASEMRYWLSRTRGNLRLALSGHGCGNAAAVSGICNHYDRRVMKRVRMLTRSGSSRGPSAGPSARRPAS